MVKWRSNTPTKRSISILFSSSQCAFSCKLSSNEHEKWRKLKKEEELPMKKVDTSHSTQEETTTSSSSRSSSHNISHFHETRKKDTRKATTTTIPLSPRSQMSWYINQSISEYDDHSRNTRETHSDSKAVTWQSQRLSHKRCIDGQTQVMMSSF